MGGYIIILMKKVRKRQISYDITYMWNLKYGTNEFIYKKETRLTDIDTNLWLPNERWVG